MKKYNYGTGWSEFQGKYIQLHVAQGEIAFGGLLPRGVQVHHVLNTLVVCPSQAYHRLLHTREHAVNACGDPNKRKCSVCKEYDDTKNLFQAQKVTHSEGQYWHRHCRSAYRRDLYRKQKDERKILSRNI